MTSLPITMENIRAKAIPLNRKAQVPQRGLKQLRQTLKGNQLALDNLAGFLRYANELLTRAEQQEATRLDVALAVVEFAGREFWFITDTSTTPDWKLGACRGDPASPG
jgi:hypothetical protein